MDGTAEIAALAQRLNASIDDEDLWHALGAALFKAGDAEGLRKLFNHRFTLYGSATTFVVSLFDRVVEDNDPGFCRDVLARYPGDCPFGAAALGFEGLCRASSFELDAAGETIRAALFRLKEVEALLPGEIFATSSTLPSDEHLPPPSNSASPFRIPALYEWATTALLLEPASWRPENSLPAPNLHLWKDAAPPPSELACVAAFDSWQLKTYAGPFAASTTACLGESGIPVLTAIDPDDKALVEIEALTSAYPLLRVFIVSFPDPVLSRHPVLAEAPTLARILLAERLLERLARPVVFLENDMTLPADALRTIARFPLSCCCTRRAPFKIVEPSIFGARPGPLAQRFFDDASQYILGKATEHVPLWLLEPFALFRSVCAARTRGEAPADIAAVLKERRSLPGGFTKPHATLTKTASSQEAFPPV